MATRRMTCSLTVLATVLAALVLTADEKNEKPGAKAPEKNAGLERLKALSGEWSATQIGGKEGPGKVTYKVTAGGSAVLETLFAGTEREMLTVYYIEDGDLAMTHYCVLKNQPRMRAAAAGADPKKLVFKCAGGGAVKCDTEMHMHQATITFVDDDHLMSEWVLWKEGKPAGTHGFELTRKKSS